MTTVQTSTLPTAEALRAQVRDALRAIGSGAELGASQAAAEPLGGDIQPRPAGQHAHHR